MNMEESTITPCDTLVKGQTPAESVPIIDRHEGEGPKVLAPFKCLQIVDVYKCDPEDGVVAFMFTLKDRIGGRFAATLICRECYSRSVVKSFNRLQSVPIPSEADQEAITTTDTTEGENAAGQNTDSNIEGSGN